MAIDLIPVLTETGGGAHMAMLYGVSADTTEELWGQWCGDLMQISENAPEDYEIITCCFAHIRERVNYCYHRFGTDDEDCVLDADGKRLEVAGLSLFGKRGLSQYVKAQVEEDKICFQTEPMGGDKEKQDGTNA